MGGRIVEAFDARNTAFGLNGRGDGEWNGRPPTIEVMRSGRSARHVVDADATSNDAAAFGTILDEILQHRHGVHLFVTLVQIKGATKLLSRIEFGKGRLGDEDG